MIPGLNTNVERDEERWHIQTELTSNAPAFFTTQVFHHGAVLSTKRVSVPSGASLGELLKAQRQAHVAVVEAVQAGRAPQ